MTEKEFQRKVIQYLKSLPKTWFFKVWGGGFQRSGIPDVICCINGLFLAVELKGVGGKPTEIQKMNIKKINIAGGVGLVLYPKGFKDFQNLMREVLKCSSPIAESSVLRNALFSLNSDTLKN